MVERNRRNNCRTESTDTVRYEIGQRKKFISFFKVGVFPRVVLAASLWHRCSGIGTERSGIFPGHADAR